MILITIGKLLRRQSAGVVVGIAVGLAMLGPATGGASPVMSERLPVVASFYPLYEFARRVGGDRVAVRNLVPPGAEPHDYEPTPRDVIEINRARVLVYNGAGLEPWIARLLSQVPAAVIRVNATDGIRLGTPGTTGNRDQRDPHVWLDPVLAQRQVDNILAGLVRADPAGRALYETNAAEHKRGLAALHDRFARVITPCRKKVFVVSHASFGYLAARYGLRQISISGLEPEAEPSALKIRQILRQIRRYDVRVIYYETLVSPRVASTIAREAGARTLVLDPIEGLTDAEIRAGRNYMTVMEENLRNLAQGLDCP
jgi:zinc transport system substrate-binding protein